MMETLKGGAKRKGAPKRSKKSRSKISKNGRKPQLPRTARVVSKSRSARLKASRANSNMSLTELQFMAKSRGIPFGGLTKTKLVRKINNYF